ncbi:MAG: hypothetical protein PWQ60_2616 [Thermoanaerobacteraceae bacterium]|jgi:hypothetical protein|nr:hypothetical protein [Thermoanaerobacteraceae bacterium]
MDITEKDIEQWVEEVREKMWEQKNQNESFY